MIRGPRGPKGPGWQGLRHNITNEPVDLDETLPPNDYKFQGGENYNHHPEYHKLPEGIKTIVSPKDFAWLDDDGKKTLLHDMTHPEVGED